MELLRDADGVFFATGKDRHLVDAVTAGGVGGALSVPIVLADPGHEQGLADFMAARPRVAVAIGGKVDAAIVERYRAQRLLGDFDAATRAWNAEHRTTRALRVQNWIPAL